MLYKEPPRNHWEFNGLSMHDSLQQAEVPSLPEPGSLIMEPCHQAVLISKEHAKIHVWYNLDWSLWVICTEICQIPWRWVYWVIKGIFHKSCRGHSLDQPWPLPQDFIVLIVTRRPDDQCPVQIDHKSRSPTLTLLNWFCYWPICL